MHQRSDNRSSSRITSTRSGTSVSPWSRTGMSPRSRTGMSPRSRTGMSPQSKTGMSPRSRTGMSPRSKTGMSTRSDSRLPLRRRTGRTPKPSADEKNLTALHTDITTVDKPIYITSNRLKDMIGTSATIIYSNAEHSFNSLEGNMRNTKVSYYTNDEGRYKNEDLTNSFSNGSKKAKLPKLNHRDFPFPVKCVIHRRLIPVDVLKISSPMQWQGPDPLELERIENEFEMYAYQDQITYLDGLIEEGEELIRQSRQTEAVLSQQYAFIDNIDMYEDKVKELRSGKKSTEAALAMGSSKPNGVTTKMMRTAETNISYADSKVTSTDSNIDTRTLYDKNIIAGNAFDVKFSRHDSGIDLNMSLEKNESNKKVTRGINTIKLQMMDKGTQMYEPLLDTRRDNMLSKVTVESKCVQTDFSIIKTILTPLKIDTVREDYESKRDGERNLEPMITAKETRIEEEVIECERSAKIRRDSKLNEETSNNEETSEKLFDDNVGKEFVHEKTMPELDCVPAVLPSSQSFRLSDDQLSPLDISKTGVQFENSLCTDSKRLNVSKIVSAMRCVTRVHEDSLNKIKDQRKLLKPSHRLKKEMEIALLKEEFTKYRETAIERKHAIEITVHRGGPNHCDGKNTDAKNFQHDADDKIVRISNKEMPTIFNEFGEKSDTNVEESNETSTETKSKVYTNRKSAKPRVDTRKQNAQSKVDSGRKSSQYKPSAEQKRVRSKIVNNEKVDTGRNAAQTKMENGRNVVRLPKLDTKSNSNHRQPSVKSRAETERNMLTGRKQRAASKKNTSFDNRFNKPEPTSKYFDKQSCKSNAKRNARTHDKVPVRHVVDTYKSPPINENCEDVYNSKETNCEASTMSVEKQKAEAMFISFSSPPVDKMPNSSVERRQTAKEQNSARVSPKEASLEAKRLSQGEEDTLCNGNLQQNAQNTYGMNKLTSCEEKKCASREMCGNNVNKDLTENDGLSGHTRQKPKAEAQWVSMSTSPPLGRGFPADKKQEQSLKPGNNNPIDNQKAQWSEKFYKTIDKFNPTQRNGSIVNDMNETPTKESTAPIDIRPSERKKHCGYVSHHHVSPPPRRRRQLIGENCTKRTRNKT